MPDNHRLLTYGEAAKHLGISTQGVRRLVDRGELATIRVGAKSVRFTAGTLDDYVVARASDGRATPRVTDDPRVRQRIREIVDAAPAFTPEQERRLRALLAPNSLTSA